MHTSRRWERELKGRNPYCQRKNGGVGDHTGGPGSVAGHGGHDGRAAIEEAGGSVTAAGEMTTGTEGGNSPGSLILSREAAPRGVRSPARAILRTRASAVSKPASNWGGIERGRGRVGQTSEKGRGGEATRAYTGVHGGRGVVEMVREPGEAGSKGTADSPVFLVREARAVETLVLGRVIPGSGRLLPGDRLVVEIWADRRREEADSEK